MGTILVVEDEPAIAAAVAARLESAGHDVEVCHDGADAVALYWACLRAGLVYVPLNTAYTAEEVGYFVGDAEASVFVTGPGGTRRRVSVATTVRWRPGGA